MNLNFLGGKCQYPESIFGVLIKFMLSHSGAFSYTCSLCPFGHCYKYFIGLYAAFQVLYSAKELSRLFKDTSREEDRPVAQTIPYLNIAITQHNSEIIRHTLVLSSNLDLAIRTLSCESATELVSFTFTSLLVIIYSWTSYCLQFSNMKREQQIVGMAMNIAAIVNLAFLLCFVFDTYKNCTFVN